MASLGIRPSSKPSGAPQAPRNEKIIKSTVHRVPNTERKSNCPNTTLWAFKGGHEYVIILQRLSTVQRRLFYGNKIRPTQSLHFDCRVLCKGRSIKR